MNYIQYMKPGNKFWALPNGQEDVSWSEFWNNWKEAIAKAKEQIADNWENLKQDYKDAVDPIAASERKQAESIEVTRAKQASMKFVSDNRTDYEKKIDRKNFELKEFEQKQQLNKDATDAVMWTLTGIPYAVQHLASPNGVVKTYGNTKAAIQNGGGPYIEKAVASAAGDVLDATILVAPLFTPEARLARAMNKNIRNTKLLPTIVLTTSTTPDNNIRIKVGDVEVNDPTMMYRQGHLEIVDDFVDKGFVARSWDPLGDGSVPPQFAEGRLWYGLPKRSNRTGLLVTKQPMRPTDASTRENIPFLTTEGSATYVTDNVGRRIPMYDKLLTTSNTDAFVFKPNYGYLRINKSNPKTSLAFFERNPSAISKAEKAGITKGMDRTIINNKEEILNNAKSFAEKYGYEIPETIDAAKAMYNLHNSFFRTPSNHESVILHYDPELAKLPLELLYFKLASKGYPESMRSYDFSKNGIYNDDFVFVAPDYGEVMPYINDVPAVMLRRPFRKSNPLTWHKDAEWTIQSKYTPYDQVFGKNKIGTAQIGNAGPLHEFKVSTRHLQPVKIAEPADKGTLLGIHLGPYEYKSGGTIHIKKKNKGKFSKIRDYVDYKNNK